MTAHAVIERPSLQNVNRISLRASIMVLILTPQPAFTRKKRTSPFCVS
jgi:hypothetical protein